VVWAILSEKGGAPRTTIKKMKIKGPDLAGLTDRKLEKWWGVKDPNRRVIVLQHIKENNPLV
jgi:hypothetical protein